MTILAGVPVMTSPGGYEDEEEEDVLYGNAGYELLHGGVGNDFGDGGPDFDTCVLVETVRNCEA
jgi:Ca2+-binding RTX toxin-like protein